MDVTKIRLNGLVTIDFPIVVASPSDVYILKAAEGLGPPGVDVSIANSVIQGGVYQGRRPQNREIVMRVGLNPNYALNQTPAELRSTLYGMLTPDASDAVLVRLLNGETVIGMTSGYVSKIEIATFTKEPEVQITIQCVKPYFAGPDLITVVPTTKDLFIIPNEGNAPAGFDVEVTFNSARSTWSLLGFANEKMQFDYAFVNGDVLKFNTRPGWRSIEVVRNGVTTNIIHSLSFDSVWIMLRGGDNTFETDMQVFSWGFVSYTPQFWGL